jgi:hypothetical protein
MSKESDALQAIVDSRKLDVSVYPHLGNYRHAPTGEPYKGYAVWNMKKNIALISMGRTLYTICQNHPGSTLYWRCKFKAIHGATENLDDPRDTIRYGWKVYARFLVSDKPVIQSHDFNEVQKEQDEHLNQTQQA